MIETQVMMEIRKKQAIVQNVGHVGVGGHYSLHKLFLS